MNMDIIMYKGGPAGRAIEERIKRGYEIVTFLELDGTVTVMLSRRHRVHEMTIHIGPGRIAVELWKRTEGEVRGTSGGVYAELGVALDAADAAWHEHVQHADKKAPEPAHA